MIHYFYGTLQVGIGQTLCSFEHVSCFQRIQLSYCENQKGELFLETQCTNLHHHSCIKSAMLQTCNIGIQVIVQVKCQ